MPRNFRKLPIEERRRLLRAALSTESTGNAGLGGQDSAFELEWADAMVESAVGYLSVPLGVATGFLIDGVNFCIPMAIEEPSVIAAATYAGTLISKHGGFKTWATEPEMVSQIFLEKIPEGGEEKILASKKSIEREISPVLSSMQRRGGGFRDLRIARLDDIGILRVDILIDVRDAMGANLINTAAEHLRELVESISGGTALMCILTNEALHRRAGASFRLPLSRLRRGETDGIEAGRRIAIASEVAHTDASRAVTHNKGVMNGISALALATGNDTRAIEAAVHRWAARDGSYRGVTHFRVEKESLVGEIEIPLPFATTGGSVGFHPSTATALRLLGNPDGPTLSRVAAALGLAQNFAAVHALVTEGIQKGHMKMHSARLALQAGARGDEVRVLADRIAATSSYSLDSAQTMLEQLRSEKS